MLGLIALLIFFMFRNGRKRQQAMQELQAGLRPGAEVMLQSGIFATVDSLDEENGRVSVTSGTSTFVVHRNAVSQIVAPVEEPEDVDTDLAPDDDPAFGERVDGTAASDASASTGDAEPSTDAVTEAENSEADKPEDDRPGTA